MEFRLDFFLGMFVATLLSGVGPMVQYIIFTKTNGYPGWTLNQIILFQGILLLWSGIKDTAFGDVRTNVETMVRRGEFDRLLLKPYPPIGIILSGGFYYYGAGSIIAGIIVTAYAFQRLNLSVGLPQMGLFLLFIVSGIVFYMAVTVLYCTIAVMIVFTSRIGEIMEKILRFSQYPVEIFPMVTRMVLLTFVPMAVWVYFPAQALLNRLDEKALISVAASFVLFWLSVKLWDLCLKKYTSAGG